MYWRLWHHDQEGTWKSTVWSHGTCCSQSKTQRWILLKKNCSEKKGTSSQDRDLLTLLPVTRGGQDHEQGAQAAPRPRRPRMWPPAPEKLYGVVTRESKLKTSNWPKSKLSLIDSSWSHLLVKRKTWWQEANAGGPTRWSETLPKKWQSLEGAYWNL